MTAVTDGKLSAVVSGLRAGALVTCAALVALVGCTEAALQPAGGDAVPTYDNKLEIRATFCAQPDNNVVFPVKVLFMFDRSYSWQCTDSQNHRVDALRAMVDTILSSGATTVGFVGFATESASIAFTRDRALFEPLYLPLAPPHDQATDYQGGFATALRVLETDMLATTEAERARTRYVIVFVSDGSPEPRCLAGCEDDEVNCADREDNDGDGDVDGADSDCLDVSNGETHPDVRYGICNTTLSLTDLRRTDPGLYADFDGICPAYNEPGQIMKRVDDILALQDLYSVGGITLNTVLVFSSLVVSDQRCIDMARQFGYEHDAAAALLRAIARAGHGTFRDANMATVDNSFLQFDFSSLNAAQALASFGARNVHAVRSNAGMVPDRDTDGLSDTDEFLIDTDPDNRDSDPTGPDGYTDAFEHLASDRGFDPLDADSPAVGCAFPTDLDGDGLRDCEENYLGTTSRNPDSDGDLMLDGDEFRAGTDPLRNDALEDLDFDGTLNREEIYAGTRPTVPDASIYRDERIQYGSTDLGRRMVRSWESGREQERTCYSLAARNLQLVETQLVGADRGLNRVLLYAVERPAELGGVDARGSVACVETYYRGETYKLPADGLVDLSDEAWERVLDQIQLEIQSLATCDWFASATIGRYEIEDVIGRCMPPSIVLGRYALDQAAVMSLLNRYVATNGAVDLRQPASELFVPMETFNPGRDCFRPWELDRVSQLFASILATCGSCGTTDEDGNPPSPCCEAGSP